VSNVKRKASESLETPSKRIKITQNVNNDYTNKINESKCNIFNLKNLNKHIKNVHKEMEMQ